MNEDCAGCIDNNSSMQDFVSYIWVRNCNHLFGHKSCNPAFATKAWITKSGVKI